MIKLVLNNKMIKNPRKNLRKNFLEKCSECNGTGHSLDDRSCPSCNGKTVI